MLIGSGNGLAKCLKSTEALESALHVIKGSTTGLDILRIVQPGCDPIFSFLSINYGFIADVDTESEVYRWAGPARLTMYGIQRMLKLRKYGVKVWYLPSHTAVHHPEITQKPDVPDQEAAAKFHPRHGPPVTHPFPHGTDPTLHGWRLYEGKVVAVELCNAPWLSYEHLIAPYSGLGDGHMDLIIMDEQMTSMKLAGLMLSPEDAKHVGLESVHYVKAKAVFFQPQEDRGVFNIDGEVSVGVLAHSVEGIRNCCVLLRLVCLVCDCSISWLFLF
eukprot:m.221186 g.221186  ORF g.221186 m.221186 type:complete len:274 (-) comp15127_c0_seq1:454-1275(-)